VHPNQVRARRKLLERVLTGGVGHGERGGAAERRNDGAVQGPAALIGDLAFDEPGVG